MLDGDGGVGMAAAIGEAVRRDVDDSHDQAAVHGKPGDGRARRGDAGQGGGDRRIARAGKIGIGPPAAGYRGRHRAR